MRQNEKGCFLTVIRLKKRGSIGAATAWLRFKSGCAAKLPLLLLLTLPALVQAQYKYTTNNNTITITKYTGFDGAVTIPSTINGLPVASIGYRAFYNSTSLISVTVPNSISSIGSVAFSDLIAPA